MPANASASSSIWSDLPIDLLRDISGRLQIDTDYISFHAVCKPWRDTLPPASCRPALLPWLLSRADDAGYCKARYVFSSMSGRSAGDSHVAYIRDRGWAISVDDGAAACFLFTNDSNGFIDPLSRSTSSIPQPPYPEEVKSWVKSATGMVSSDGTVFIYDFGGIATMASYVPIFMALLLPGDTAWTLLKKNDFTFSASGLNIRCLAYHDGKIVQCFGICWLVMSLSNGTRARGYVNIDHVESTYLVESRGELL